MVNSNQLQIDKAVRMWPKIDLRKWTKYFHSVLQLERGKCQNTYQSMLQDSACSCLTHQQHQRSCTRRRLFFQSCLQGPLEVCFVLLSGDESCPVRAKIHRSDIRSLVCSCPSCGRNQPSRPISFGTLSITHRLWFGHKTYQRYRHCRGRWYKHRLFVFQLCRVRHSSCKLKL